MSDSTFFFFFFSPGLALRTGGNSGSRGFPLPFPDSPSHKQCDPHTALLCTQAPFPRHRAFQHGQNHLSGSRGGACSGLRGEASLLRGPLKKVAGGEVVRGVPCWQRGTPVALASDRSSSSLALRLYYCSLSFSFLHCKTRQQPAVLQTMGRPGTK